ncbi:hypothetical protein B6V76_18570 [Thioclava sp. IC9]|nr:hypothetical protein B6V76_18570 [Thioclava sp. IC9]
MATYNGSGFLSEQLDSLAAQSRLPDELVVGDDGSTDSTLEIVENFRRNAPFPVHIHRNEVNLGFAGNFLSTAQRCNGDWIAFCDQDDVWLPNKLSDAVTAIEVTPNCCMVLQNAWLSDKMLSARGRKFPDKISPGSYGANTQYGFWVWLGCLQTVDRRILQLWDRKSLPRNYFAAHPQISHDKWTCIIANAIGGIVVLDEPAALYRRHDDALTGDYAQQSLVERVSKARSVSADHYDFLADVAGEYSGYMEYLSKYVDDLKWSSAFRNGAYSFRELEVIQRLRADLYNGNRLSSRLRSFETIFRKGGYFGSPFFAMGARSATKDAFCVMFGA